MDDWPTSYKTLKKNFYKKDKFKLIPIRYEDRYDIMNWRNEQLYHLRQKKKLTKILQDNYFQEEVKTIFNHPKPKQLLFSMLKNDKLIAYGGLVHIDWDNRGAEISFVIKTKLEKINFKKYWGLYLEILNEIAFDELNLNKIYVYAYDIRKKLYNILEKKDFILEARLKNHVLIENQFKDVIIYSKFNDYK